jgi:cytochrome c553
MNWKIKTLIIGLALAICVFSTQGAEDFKPKEITISKEDGKTIKVTITKDTKALWDKQCAKCHGKDGKGKTKMGRKTKVKDYTDPNVQKAFKYEKMLKSLIAGIKEKGKTKMKPYKGKLNEKQINELIAYCFSFGKKK